MTRREIDELTELAQAAGAPRAWRGSGWKRTACARPIAKFLRTTMLPAVLEAAGAEPGDLLLFVADQREMAVARSWAGCACGWRRRNVLDGPDASSPRCWIVDLPLFNRDAEDRRLGAAHHPFTAPVDEDLELLEDRAGTGAGQGVRPGHQRLRAGRRQHPDPPPGRAGDGLRRARADRGGSPGQVRLPAGRVRVRRAAPRRHRLRLRPPGHAAGGHGQHPRRHRRSRRRKARAA